MTIEMKKTVKNMGWLVMAAALTVGFTACSNDDNDAIEEQPVNQPVTTTIHVTVGAGIADDGTTRASVTGDGSSTKPRSMTFTTGDALYVYYEDQSGNYTAYGTLNHISITSGSNDKEATFSGDLNIVKKDASVATPTFSNLDGFTATLLPAKETTDKESVVIDENHEASYREGFITAPSSDTDLNAAIAKYSYVTGTVKGSSVDLSAQSAFLDVNISDLAPSTSYYVSLNPDEYCKTQLTSDEASHLLIWHATGAINVLGINFNKNENSDGYGYDTNDKRVYLTGSVTLDAKVYKGITASAKSYTPFSVKSGDSEVSGYTLTIAGEGGLAENTSIVLNNTSNTVTFEKAKAASKGAPFIRNEVSGGTLNIVLNGNSGIRTNADNAITLGDGGKVVLSTPTDVTKAYTLTIISQKAPTFTVEAATGYNLTTTGYKNSDGTYSYKYKVKKR